MRNLFSFILVFLTISATCAVTPKTAVDFSPSQLYLSAVYVHELATYTVSVQVNNSGASPVGASNVAYFISADSIYDPGDTLVGQGVVGIIGVNAAVTVIDQVVIPSNIGVGDKYLIAVLDYDNLYAELDESNNVAHLPIHVYDNHLDVTAELVHKPGNLYAKGSTYSFYVRMENFGSLATNTPKFGLYLSADEFFDPGDSLLYLGTAQDMLMGSFEDFIFSATIPTNTSVHNGFLLLMVDPGNVIDEWNEENNLLVIPANVVEPYVDLSIEHTLFYYLVVNDGSNISVATTLRNAGTMNAQNVKLSGYLSKDDSLDSTDQFIGQLTNQFVGPDSTTLDTINCVIPQGTPQGNYHLILSVNPDSSIQESVYYNNLTSLPIIVRNSQHDMKALTPDFTSGSLYPAGTSTVTCFSYNNGHYSESGLGFGLYLSADTILDASDTILYAGTYTASIAVGAIGSRQITIHFPANISGGDYYLLQKVDPAGQISESDELNNLAYRKVSLRPSYNDLVIMSPRILSQKPYLGGSMYFTSSVKNSGTITSPITQVEYFVSLDSILDASDELIYQNTVSAINPGSSVGQNFTYTVAQGGGEYYLLFKADASDVISETDEANNCVGLKFSVYDSLLDFVPVKLGITMNCATAGSWFKATAGVMNLGPKDAFNVPCSFYFSRDTILDAMDSMFRQTTIPYVSPYSTNQAISATGFWPDTISDGTYYILVVVDDGNEFVETNETNNIAWYPVTIDNVSDHSYLLPAVSGKDTIYVTSTELYDDGGPLNNASMNIKDTLVIMPQNPGEKVGIRFFYEPGINLGGIQIYNGTNTNAPYILQNYGVMSDNPSGALTLVYTTTTTSIPGFEANLFTTTTNVNSLVDFVPVIHSIDQFTNIEPGGTIVAKSCYMNYGQSMNASSYYGYYLSSDSVFDASDILVKTGTYFYSGLASAINTYTLTIPANAVSGDQYLLLVVDPDNLRSEANENNNTLVLPVNISKPAGETFDLQVLPYMSQSYIWNPSVSLGVTAYSIITNRGGNASSNPYTVKYYLSLDSIIDASDIVLDSSSHSSLEQNGSITEGAAFSIPWGTNPGNYYLIEYIDAGNSNQETNESNNILISSLSIVPHFSDLQIVSFKGDSVRVPGDLFFGDYTIFNMSSLTVNAQINTYFSTSPVWDSLNAYYGATTFTVYINSGRSASMPCFLPDTIPAGDYYLMISVNDASGYQEINYANNFAFIKVRVDNPHVDLKVKAQSINKGDVLTAGNDMSIEYLVLNDGNYLNGNFSYSYVKNSFYLSADSLLDPGDTYLGIDSTIFDLTPYPYYSTVNLGVPGTQAPGNYFVIIKADGPDEFIEVNENNNTACYPIKIESASTDLFVKIYRASVTTLPNHTTHMEYYAENSGNRDLQSCRIGYYLSTDTIPGGGDVLLGTNDFSGTGAYSYNYVSAYPNLPYTTNGDYFILIYIDDQHVVDETNEQNNVMWYPMRLTDYYYIDYLPLYPSTSPPSCVAGDSVIMNCWFLNQGSDYAYNANAGYYLSRDTIFDYNDLLVGYNDSLNLGAGVYCRQASAYITIPDTMSIGEYYLFQFINNNFAINESNYANNRSYIPFKVEGPTLDLFLDSVYTQANISPGAELGTNCRVFNSGSAGASNFRLGYYLSADTLLDGGDSLLAYTYGSVSGHLASVVFNDSLVIPATVSEGQYYVLYAVDDDDQFQEINETDNISNALFSVTTTGIQTLSSETLLLYPNPAQTRIYINYPSALIDNVVITDITGSKVKYPDLKSFNGDIVLAIEDLEEGCYFVQMLTKTGTLNARFVKVK